MLDFDKSWFEMTLLGTQNVASKKNDSCLCVFLRIPHFFYCGDLKNCFSFGINKNSSISLRVWGLSM